MNNVTGRFIVCQIGAREHYSVPRTLLRAGVLAELITDVWVPPESPVCLLPGRAGERLRGRYHPELGDAKVTHFNSAAFAREAVKLLSTNRSRWNSILGQNRWFQAEAVRHLKASRAFEDYGDKCVVLAYSYAALDILKLARDRGAKTILGQIDGGQADEQLISERWCRSFGAMPDKAPSAYWTAWREECHLADRILVNSEWSKHLLMEAGIEEAKLEVSPVVYERASTELPAPHTYPTTFDVARPLRVLFLGALTIRKGVLEALEAAQQLLDRPVEFTFVGGDPEGQSRMMRGLNIIRHDRVPRSQVLKFYRDADVFLFPTHSDGFGMTQIEALESGLPVIASRHCAELVEHGKTGLLLEDVTATEIVRAIEFSLGHPEQLAAMSVSALASGAAFAKHSSNVFLDAVREFSSPECE